MARLLILFIRLYQLTLSRLLGRCCRFYPTCSQYTIEALQRHGLFRGGWMALKRIAKCHPFHPGGVDPVPPPKTALDRYAPDVRPDFGGLRRDATGGRHA